MPIGLSTNQKGLAEEEDGIIIETRDEVRERLLLREVRIKGGS